MEEQQDPIDIVRAFCRAWDLLDMNMIEGFLADDICYYNIPMTPLQGKATVMRYLRSLDQIEACSWQLRAIAADGAVVLTERVDRLLVRGTPVMLPVMGAFEIENGHIRHWRDYFDLASYRAQWPQAETI